MKKDLVSIVIPVYGDKRLVKLLYDRLIASLLEIDIDYEIIMVNDACPYGSGAEIEKLAKACSKVKFIDMARNFGQHLSIKAGLDYAQGDYVVVMDCDLQDNPDDIIKFYNKIKEGYDVVFGYKISRKDSLLKRLYSKCAANLLKYFSEHQIKKNQSNFSIISKEVVEYLKQCDETSFVFSALISWFGYKTGYLEIEQNARAFGKSGYNFFKGFKHFMHILISNSNKPLSFAVYCSFIMFVLCLIFVIKLLLDYFINSKLLIGWTSLMVSIFFIASLFFAYQAILGLYIGHIFERSKKRPLYTIKNKINL